MANAVYGKWKNAAGTAASNTSMDQNDTTNGPFIVLIDTGAYTFSQSHQFYSSLAGIVGSEQRIVNPTFGSVSDGTFDGDNVTFTAVTGNSVEALAIFRKNSGANTTWRMFSYHDTSVTGLPITPNGGDITVTFNASGIVTISDRRLKENVREVGDLHGVLPVYEYNYLGEERLRLGLMAQDVEKIEPAAVIDFGKYKAVDYDRAIAACERLAA
jgi:hypothetical protein